MQKIRIGALSRLLALGAIAFGSNPAPALEDSGPVIASRDGQVIQGLRIDVTGRPAIVVNGVSNVVIRDVEILHEDAPGISCSLAPGLIVENASITHSGTDIRSPQENNIDCYRVDGLRVRNVRLTGGSTGIYVLESEHVHLSRIEGYDFRGPFPRGQLVQFNMSPHCILEDFSAINDPAVAWTEDNVSVYDSDNCVIRRGLLDGNNSPSGVGANFELSAAGLVEDVDTVHQGNGSFGAHRSSNIIFRRTRAKDNICTDQGRGPPLSTGIIWSGYDGVSGLRIEDSQHWNPCNPLAIVYDVSQFAVVDVSEDDFTPRSPILLSFPWERDDPTPAPGPEPRSKS